MSVIKNILDKFDQKQMKMVFYQKHKMPCCGGTSFTEGPSGGASQNIRCADCGTEFNICPPMEFIEKIGGPEVKRTLLPSIFRRTRYDLAIKKGDS